jgi:hypothetical protein
MQWKTKPEKVYAALATSNAFCICYDDVAYALVPRGTSNIIRVSFSLSLLTWLAPKHGAYVHRVNIRIDNKGDFWAIVSRKTGKILRVETKREVAEFLSGDASRTVSPCSLNPIPYAKESESPLLIEDRSLVNSARFV